MFKIRFSFLNGTSEYYWIKKLYSKEESNILSYLELSVNRVTEIYEKYKKQE